MRANFVRFFKSLGLRSLGVAALYYFPVVIIGSIFLGSFNHLGLALVVMYFAFFCVIVAFNYRSFKASPGDYLLSFLSYVSALLIISGLYIGLVFDIEIYQTMSKINGSGFSFDSLPLFLIIFDMVFLLLIALGLTVNLVRIRSSIILGRDISLLDFFRFFFTPKVGSFVIISSVVILALTPLLIGFNFILLVHLLLFTSDLLTEDRQVEQS
ncbi:MAG: hypothetical protein IBX55_00100 [Methyloprofundus sp.]|nr:hypothetical protein [Methyloprofundus sp.]